MSDRAARLAIAALSIVGIAVAGYLSWARAAGETVACPVAGGGCETVQQSSYSELVGIPVAYLGVATYVVLLVLALWDREETKAAVAAVALAGTAFAVYLLFVMAFVIDAVCVWCLASDVVIATIAGLSVWRLRLAPTPSGPDGAPSARSGRGSPSGSRPSR